MSSTLKKGKKKEEVTPEALLEHLEEIKRRKESFFTYISDEEQEENIPKLQKLLDELKPTIRNAIHKANAGAKMKAETMYSFGKFVASYEYLMAFHKIAFDLSLVYREDLYKELIKYMEDAIEVFYDIEKGEPLDRVVNRLDLLTFYIRSDVEKFIKPLEEHVEDLEGSVCGP